jgi:anhydro-N-acetylmuramic acid kinase
MVYKAIGLMSGSSLDGLDMAYVQFQETGGKWQYNILHADCILYTPEWKHQLNRATSLMAAEYQLLHTAYGHYTGEQVNLFIDRHELHHKVDLVASHGHTTFHLPSKKMTAQLGDGAAIAAVTELPVVSDLRALDIAFGGQGAPVVPIGEKLLFSEYDFLLNLGGIANITAQSQKEHIAFDVCPANRVLDLLAAHAGKEFDENGTLASAGKPDERLLHELGNLEYYGWGYPKSLANDFGTEKVYPMIKAFSLSIPDALRTYTEHICNQVTAAISRLLHALPLPEITTGRKLLVTGGGAFNSFLILRLQDSLDKLGIKTEVPDKQLVNFKEALVMALMGVLRWREEYNVLSSVTGAARNSIGGALWLGGEA